MRAVGREQQAQLRIAELALEHAEQMLGKAVDFLQIAKEIASLEKQMLQAAKNLEFELAVGRRGVVVERQLGGVVDLALLDAATGRRLLDAHLDDISHAGIPPLRSAQHLDTHHRTRASVIGDFQSRFCLDHFNISQLAPCAPH